MHYFSTLFGKQVYMFRRELLYIIGSLNTVFTVTVICHTEILKIGKFTSICMYIYIHTYICTFR